MDHLIAFTSFHQLSFVKAFNSKKVASLIIVKKFSLLLHILTIGILPYCNHLNDNKINDDINYLV